MAAFLFGTKRAENLGTIFPSYAMPSCAPDNRALGAGCLQETTGEELPTKNQSVGDDLKDLLC